MHNPTPDAKAAVMKAMQRELRSIFLVIFCIL